MSDVLQVLQEKRNFVWKEVEKYLGKVLDLPHYCQIPPKYQKLARLHLEMVSDYPKRQGKYLRPTLVLLVAGAMGFEENKAIKTAAAMQVSEEWMLIHDDVEDDSPLRRGKPVLHRVYGKELAINAGDHLHALMWKILTDNIELISNKKTLAIMDEFSKIMNRTVFGQMVELKWIKEKDFKITDEDVLFVIEGKTCYYTIAGPMRLGAILAGATDKQLEQIYRLGKYLGYAFQLKDDLLDLTSTFSGLKQRGNDIFESKMTVIITHLLKTASNQDKKHLMEILEKTREEKTQKEVDWVIEKAREYGSLDHCQRSINKFIKKTKQYLEKDLSFLSCQPYRNQLEDLINFIAQREH